ncbi:ABC transporter ATP-binding protein [Cupriavidus necator]|uniref:ABC transporter ATP-binding protein n=1 Tax=Cupriavidus necator TaxID=106590 RepID=UPI00339D99E2
MSSDIAVKISGASKCYHIYERPRDRLLQMLVRGRKKYFREFWALDNVSLEIKRGETVGIVGRNGSGKSTLLQIICGTLNPSAGTAQVNGRVAALLELGSGFNPEFTGRENVFLNAAVLGLTKEEVTARFDQIAAFADIGDFIDQPVKTYSSGMYVRLAFAVVAHVDADILVIDEALAVGDAFFTQKCMRFLRRFKETGTLIFVSHDAGAVTGLCEKALWLDKGRAQVYGPAKLVSEQYLASLYESEPRKAVGGNADKGPKKTSRIPKEKVVLPDVRSALINRSSLRNDLEIFEFSPGESAEFGLRGADIVHVSIVDADSGSTLTYAVGGESVILRIEVRALKDIEQPIIGFSFKDRLGQTLFGDNTYLSYQDECIVVQSQSTFIGEFGFVMPVLPRGDYSVAVAVATGTQADHVQHHWIHDAIIVKSISSSVSTGLIGIPMQRIDITVHDDARVSD